MRATMLHLTALIALGATSLTAQGDARFSARSELVILDVAVTDDRGGFVRGLPADAFQVLEEGRPQKVSFFAEQDAPATIALLIDASGSMLLSRDRIIAGITSFAEASNPDDEFLPLMFNERVMPVVASRSGFTSDPAELRDALRNNSIGFGKTAFHDAVASAIDRVSTGGHERRVIVILSDGGDNASDLTFDELVNNVQASNLVIYTIALIDPVTLGYNRGALRRLAKTTGGLAFEPKTIAAVEKSLRVIAADIRSRYTLAYEPTDTSSGRVKRVRVIAEGPGGKDLRVRTRTGYVTGSSSPPTTE
jgi:Ca-activated chloride channel family protein